MDAVGRLSYYISQGVYTVVGPFQPFGGAVDIIVVQQEDATFKSTPWYVKFGKFQGVLKRNEKIVSVAVNDVEADFHMYLDKTGEAYFLNEVESDEEETVFSPGSSPSADEARMPSRRESFKDAEAYEDTDEQTETIIDKDGDGETDAAESRVSSNVCYSDRISKVTQNNGETLISSSEHGRQSSDKQIANGHWDSTSTLFSSSAKNDKELPQAPSGPANSEFQTQSNNMVDSSLLPSGNGRLQQGSTIGSPLVRELLNVDVVPVVSNHGESSMMEKIEGNVVKIEHSADPTEYLGRVLEEGWYSQAETSVYVVEGSPGIRNVSGDQISQNDVVLLSGYGAYNYENMNLPQLEPISDTAKLENDNSEVVLMSVDGHVMTAPISSFKDSESTDFFGRQLHLVVDQVDCIQSEERIKPIQQVLNAATEHGTSDHELVSEEFICQQKLQEDTGETDLSDDLVTSRASNSIVEENFADQDDCIQCNVRINFTQQALHASTEYGTVDHELPPKEFICQGKTQEDIGEIDLCDDLVKRRASNSVGEGNLLSQFNFNNSKCPSDSERQCKQIGQLADEMHGIGFECHKENNAREPDECCPQVKKVNTCEMSRNESVEELEFTFNDEDIFKSCLSLPDLSSPMQEEVKQCSLSIPIEEECSVDGSNKNDIKSSFDVFQISKFQAFQKEGSHISGVAIDSKLEHSRGSTSNVPRAQTSPLLVPGVHLNGGTEFAQAADLLPNMGVHFPTSEISDAEGVFSHSFNVDAACFKQASNEDALPPTSQNMEPTVSKKDIMQISTAIETSGLQNWNKRETLIASVRPDMDNGTDLDFFTNICIEISLCKHLLSEGMGIDAAAQAFDSERVSREEFSSSGASIIRNENLIVRIRGHYFAWDAAAPIIMGMAVFGLEAPAEPEGAISVDRVEKLYASDSNVSSGGGWRLWPFPFRRPKTPERIKSAGSALNNEQIVDPEPGLQSPHAQASVIGNGELVIGNDYCRGPQKHMMRTNTPTSEQLASLNLKEGQNVITFTFLTRVLGRQQVDARIYLWKWNTRIVVSDVDGTITKSDVLGQVMPLVGKDWTQTGVARLFSAIKDNGYQLLFLSARAISQAYLTRQFLLNLKQDGKALPDGPVLISPDGLFPSLYREVIRRAPHEFKIACLEDIRSLFPSDCNPFYAGFGNRDTDEISYLKVGIPKGKIFIINPKGEVVVNHSVDVKSYTSLHKLVNDMFPSMSSCEQEDFNSWNYWKVPLPDIED